MHPHLAGRTLADVLTERTQERGHRPLVTVYDDATGARTELSYATADNWAGKSANLLAEELDVVETSVVALDLDGHWTATVLALACWKLGATVAPGVAGDAAVTCCHESRAAAHPDGPLVVVGDGLRSEPTGGVAPRDGLVLLGEEVHAFGDDYVDPGVSPGHPALRAGDATLDHAAVIDHAAQWVDALGTDPRVGLAAPLDGAAALVLLAGVVAAGGSLVAARRPSGPQWDRWSTEKVTAVVGADGGGSTGLPTFELTRP